MRKATAHRTAKNPSLPSKISTPRAESGSAPASKKSIEHAGDLFDVDAFLRHAQLVIRDNNQHSEKGTPDPVPDQGGNIEHDHVPHCPQYAADDQADDDRNHIKQDENSKHLPAVTFCQISTALHALPRTSAFNDTGG